MLGQHISFHMWKIDPFKRCLVEHSAILGLDGLYTKRDFNKDQKETLYLSMDNEQKKGGHPFGEMDNGGQAKGARRMGNKETLPVLPRYCNKICMEIGRKS